MGTRNLTKVIKNNKVVVAQYGQWDGYPSGQGATVFFAIQKPGQMEGLENNLYLTYEPSDDERMEMAKPFLDGSMPGMMTIESGKLFSEKYPSLSRDTGASILNVIAEATEPVPLYLDIDFENDELFCEGVYTVNLDNKTFTSKFDGREVRMSFSEVRTGTVGDYLIRFYPDDPEHVDELVESVRKTNLVTN
mgnify:CR=1 FL=1